jgi:hypothetical protein
VLTRENEFATAATGTLVGVIAIVVEELDVAGALSRARVTQRLETFLLSNAQGGDESASPYAWLEKEIIGNLLEILAPPPMQSFKLAVIAGTDVEAPHGDQS